jgi:ABC-type uncharacterized transport system permease subunit
VRIADHPLDARHLRQFVGSALRIATRYQNAGVRIFAMHAADGGSRVAIGLRGDGAGIQDHELGISAIGGLKTTAGELRFERCAIGLGRTTSEILHEKAHGPFYCGRATYTGSSTFIMGESSLLWLRVAAGLYSLGLIDAIVTVLRRRESLFRIALGAFGLGAIFQLVSIVEQGLVQHHFPVNDFFEVMSLCAWLFTLAFLTIYWRYKAESLSVFVFPLVFVMTLVAALSNPVSRWSSESVKSTWLTVHIVLALLGYAALLFTAVAAVAYLMQERELKRKQPRSFYRIFPPLGMLDELISRSLGAGFVFLTVSLIIIIIWASNSYGSHLVDNGLISTSGITWGIYLALIFFRVSAGWRGRKAAIMSIIALCCSAATWIAHSGLENHLAQ